MEVVLYSPELDEIETTWGILIKNTVYWINPPDSDYWIAIGVI